MISIYYRDSEALSFDSTPKNCSINLSSEETIIHFRRKRIQGMRIRSMNEQYSKKEIMRTNFERETEPRLSITVDLFYYERL